MATIEDVLNAITYIKGGYLYDLLDRFPENTHAQILDDLAIPIQHKEWLHAMHMGLINQNIQDSLQLSAQDIFAFEAKAKSLEDEAKSLEGDRNLGSQILKLLCFEVSNLSTAEGQITPNLTEHLNTFLLEKLKKFAPQLQNHADQAPSASIVQESKYEPMEAIFAAPAPQVALEESKQESAHANVDASSQTDDAFAELQNEVQRLQDDNAASVQALTSLQQDHSALRTQISQQAVHLSELQADIHSKDVTITQLQDEIKFFKMGSHTYKEKLKHTQDALLASQEEVAKVAIELQKAKIDPEDKTNLHNQLKLLVELYDIRLKEALKVGEEFISSKEEILSMILATGDEKDVAESLIKLYRLTGAIPSNKEVNADGHIIKVFSHAEYKKMVDDLLKKEKTKLKSQQNLTETQAVMNLRFKLNSSLTKAQMMKFYIEDWRGKLSTTAEKIMTEFTQKNDSIIQAQTVMASLPEDDFELVDFPSLFPALVFDKDELQNLKSENALLKKQLESAKAFHSSAASSSADDSSFIFVEGESAYVSPAAPMVPPIAPPMAPPLAPPMAPLMAAPAAPPMAPSMSSEAASSAPSKIKKPAGAPDLKNVLSGLSSFTLKKTAPVSSSASASAPNFMGELANKLKQGVKSPTSSKVERPEVKAPKRDITKLDVLALNMLEKEPHYSKFTYVITRNANKEWAVSLYTPKNWLPLPKLGAVQLNPVAVSLNVLPGLLETLNELRSKEMSAISAADLWNAKAILTKYHKEAVTHIKLAPEAVEAQASSSKGPNTIFSLQAQMEARRVAMSGSKEENKSSAPRLGSSEDEWD